MRSDLLVMVMMTLTAALAVGCEAQRTIQPSSVVDMHAAADAELDFWDGLAEERVVTNNDALHGLLLVASEEAAATNYETRVAAARQRGWITADADPPANESATVGMVAVAVCDVLELEGGVTMRIFGPSARYCTRELMALEYIPWRSENRSLSGLELIELLNRVEDELAR